MNRRDFLRATAALVGSAALGSGCGEQNISSVKVNFRGRRFSLEQILQNPFFEMHDVAPKEQAAQDEPYFYIDTNSKGYPAALVINPRGTEFPPSAGTDSIEAYLVKAPLKATTFYLPDSVVKLKPTYVSLVPFPTSNEISDGLLRFPVDELPAGKYAMVVHVKPGTKKLGNNERIFGWAFTVSYGTGHYPRSSTGTLPE